MTQKKNGAIAIVGAGIAGLTCASQLQSAGFDVTVFDKSRGVGGRVSTRRGEDGATFDHGAQYFTVKDPAFAEQVKVWTSAGVAAIWDCRIGNLCQREWLPLDSHTDRYVGVPAMNAIAKHLARDLNLQLQTRVQTINLSESGWQLESAAGKVFAGFDALVLNAPADQTADLAVSFPEFAAEVGSAEISPCWAVMLGFEKELAVAWDAAFVKDAEFSWIARNSSKPSRPTAPDCWVLHASSDWSNQHLEASPEEVLEQLLPAFWSAVGCQPRPHMLATSHRWRFALPSAPLEKRFLFHTNLSLGACGDWCGGPRVEGAYLSGLALANRFIEVSL